MDEQASRGEVLVQVVHGSAVPRWLAVCACLIFRACLALVSAGNWSPLLQLIHNYFSYLVRAVTFFS
jgi:hypothetical protein